MVSRFSFHLAAVVFGDADSSLVPPLEARCVERFREWLDAANLDEVRRACERIDDRLLPVLGHVSMLAVARLIEARCPEVIERMPRLLAHRDHLDRTQQLAQVFMGPQLVPLIEALRETGTRGSRTGTSGVTVAAGESHP